jgi:hypothetical protein
LLPILCASWVFHANFCMTDARRGSCMGLPRGEGAIGIRSTSQEPGWESELHTYRDDALSPMLTRLGFAVAIHDNPLH